MAKYLFVTHIWHADSKDFSIELHELESNERAYEMACTLSAKHGGARKMAVTKYVEIEQAERALVDRNLTWKERLTGKINREA